jgi:glycosyltransferase involved in cell wall biosynthesis
LLLALNDPRRNPGILPVKRLEVWTTCAKDHRTWENAHPPGRTVEDALPVFRFPVDKRNLDVFIKAELSLAGGRPLSVDEQLAWLQAGVNSRALYAHIATNAPHFDAVLFAPYLFSTTFWGAYIAPEKALLIPCLHNESYAYLEVFRHLFRAARGLLYNAAPEKELAEQLYGSSLAAKGRVVGMGFIPPEALNPREADATPYLLYSGRKEQGKNLDKLIQWFSEIQPSFPNLELKIIGSGEIAFLQSLPPGVRDLGFVSESEKLRLMRNALALCQPSTNESFSIVLMEAWLCGTPVIVHADCPVTRHHVSTSGGGLYCGSSSEFRHVVALLLADPHLRTALGRAGEHYVRTEYDWSCVLRRFREALQACSIISEQENDRREHQEPSGR